MSKSSSHLPEEELFIDEQDPQTAETPEQQKVSWADKVRGLLSGRHAVVMAGAMAAVTASGPANAQKDSPYKMNPLICKTVLECSKTLQEFARTGVATAPFVESAQMEALFDKHISESYETKDYLWYSKCYKYDEKDTSLSKEYQEGCEKLAARLRTFVARLFPHYKTKSLKKAYSIAVNDLKGPHQILMLNLAALLLPHRNWVNVLGLDDDTKLLEGKKACFVSDGCTKLCGSIGQSDTGGVAIVDDKTRRREWATWDKLIPGGNTSLVIGDPKNVDPNWGKNRKNCRRIGPSDSTKRILEMRKELSILRNEIALSNPNAVYPHADVGYLGVETPKQPFTHFVKLGVGGGVTWNRYLPTDIKFTTGAICSPASKASDGSVKGLDNCAFYVQPSLGFRARIASLSGGSELQLNLAPFRFIGTSAGGLGWLPSIGLEYWGGKNRSYVLGANLVGGYYNSQQSASDDDANIIQGSTIGATISGNLWFLDGNLRI